ncbi:MAG: PLP-dependent aminotransferase family protein [Chloroflexi bacterium]|nr:PLP-dependent aminotransferase family protein [Chloroflexota bacterium]
MTTRLPSLLVDIREGVIDLGWGHPSPRLHPLEAIREAADRLFSRGGTEPLQYGATQGYGPYLETLAEFLSRQECYGMSVDPRSLFLTAGASQGLDLTCTLFAREGDTVLVEEPTYFVVERIFRAHHLDVRGVPTDGDGLDVGALEAMLETGGLRPKLLYTIPSYHNPTGSVLPECRRRRLVELAHRFDFLVLADEVYQMVHFADIPPRPVIAFDDGSDGKTISYGSFSKVLSPGMRIGWIHTAQGTVDRFADAAVTFSGGGFNHFASALVREVIELGLLDENIGRLRAVYAQRADAMDQAIRERLGDIVEFRKPSGGYYFWLRFPGGLDTVELLPLAEERGVSYRPGNAFSESGRFTDFLRLTYTLYEKDELEEGIRRLADAVASFKGG